MNGESIARRGGGIAAGAWKWLALVLGVVVIALAALYPKWRENSNNGGQKYAAPFRIAGNLYYVGANDVSSFLLTGPEGDVLIDGGYPGTAPMIIASIRKLGFDIKDVKVLLNSEPHFDHAGGLAALQKASGAELWASDASAKSIESGGDDPDISIPVRMLVWSGIISYPAAHVDHRVKDGDTISLGPIEITAHITPGHTRGCTSWSFPVRDGGRELTVVSACSLVALGLVNYPEQRSDFEHTISVLRGLPADIWVSSHARLWGRYRKYVARDTAKDPAAPFIDPAGYRAYIDSGAATIRRGVTH